MLHPRTLPVTGKLRGRVGSSLRHIQRWTVTVGTSLLSGSADPSQSIVVAGSPRSGTTWVASLLTTIPSSAVLFEPLYLREVRGAERAGFTWRTFVEPGTPWPAGEAFMHRVLSGRVLNDWTTQEIGAPRRVRTWVVKFVRANRLLPWITERFDVREPILLVRHPCAVVASRLSRGWPTGRGTPDEDHPFGSDVNAYTASLEHDEERLAAQWALDVLVPLTRPKPWPWHVVWFEQLLTEGPGHLAPIFDRWGLETPNEIEDRFERLSSTTRRSTDVKLVLDRWRDTLEPEQVTRILRVTQQLGVGSYDASPLPDLSARLTPPAFGGGRRTPIR